MPTTRSRRAQAQAPSSPVQSDTDPSFAALPRDVQTRIDRAFHRALPSTTTPASPGQPARKRRKLADNAADTGGGFVLDDTGGGFVLEDAGGGFSPDTGGGFVLDAPSAPGGFIAENEDANDFLSPSAPASDAPAPRLPLSLIPTALQSLDLPPSDPEVLKVFANAATGWSSKSGTEIEGEGAVGLGDWRAVCAVLLEGADSAREEQDSGEDAGAGEEEGEEGEEESDGTSDAYVDSASDASDDAAQDDDDYAAGQRTVRRPRPVRNPAAASSGDEDETDGKPRVLTARQKAECRRAFALFLDIPLDDKNLEKRKIMIRDVDRAAGVLKEKITADDVSFIQ